MSVNVGQIFREQNDIQLKMMAFTKFFIQNLLRYPVVPPSPSCVHMISDTLRKLSTTWKQTWCWIRNGTLRLDSTRCTWCSFHSNFNVAGCGHLEGGFSLFLSYYLFVCFTFEDVTHILFCCISLLFLWLSNRLPLKFHSPLRRHSGVKKMSDIWFWMNYPFNENFSPILPDKHSIPDILVVFDVFLHFSYQPGEGINDLRQVLHVSMVQK